MQRDVQMYLFVSSSPPSLWALLDFDAFVFFSLLSVDSCLSINTTLHSSSILVIDLCLSEPARLSDSKEEAFAEVLVRRKLGEEQEVEARRSLGEDTLFAVQPLDLERLCA